MKRITKKFLIIPKASKQKASLELAHEYDLGFEFNDFFMPNVLDDEAVQKKIIGEYKAAGLPEYCTLHGAFFDVIPFSPDERIRAIGDMRIRQSVSAARGIGARAVVFHTNYNPFLSSPEYVKGWIEQNAAYWNGILTEFPDMNIYLENMFDSTPDIMAELAERLCGHGNFGICFDYAHAALTAVPQREWTEKLGRYVRHIHINDNDLQSDLHLAVGDGMIDWNEFYGLYDNYMDKATVLIETSSLENQRRSIERLLSDGFMTKQD